MGNADRFTVAGVGTNQERIAALAAGAKIYINGCPLTTAAPSIAASETSFDVEGIASSAHDCPSDLVPSAQIVYRRSDDPDNQNAYITSGDTGAAASKSVITVRGSQYIKGIDVSNGKLTFNANAVAQAAASVAFVNGFGPINLPAIAADDADVTASTATEVTNIFGATVATTDGAKFTYFIAAAAGSDQSVVSGSVLLINGRR